MMSYDVTGPTAARKLQFPPFASPASTVREARSDLLLRILLHEEALELDEETYERFRRAGWSRQDVDSAVDDLIAMGAATVRDSFWLVAVEDQKVVEVESLVVSLTCEVLALRFLLDEKGDRN